MSHPRAVRRLPILAGLIALAVMTAFVAQPGRTSVRNTRAVAAHRACPPGYLSASQDGETTLAGHVIADRLCVNRLHPESPEDIAALGAQRFAKQAATGKTGPRSSYWNA